MQAIDVGKIKRSIQRRHAEQRKNDFHHLAVVFRSKSIQPVARETQETQHNCGNAWIFMSVREAVNPERVSLAIVTRRMWRVIPGTALI